MEQLNTIDLKGFEPSEECLNAFELLEYTNTNLFITGKAGTGKSTFLEYFRKKTAKNIAIVAPTGVAALNVRGQTIHSLFRFKHGFTLPESMTPLKDPRLFQKLQILVIDEVSMVRADIFACIESFLRLNGPNPSKPFGGVQICVIGDLFQLPPIVGYREQEIFAQHYHSPFFFATDAYQQGDFHFVEFKNVYRQSEQHFIDALNAIRVANTSPALLDYLNRRVAPTGGIVENDKQALLNLTTTNRDAEQINHHKMDTLLGKAYSYKAKIEGTFDANDERLPAPSTLVLKEGAQVMFTKNDQKKRWVNGTIGVVESLSPTSLTVRVFKHHKWRYYQLERESWERIQYNHNPQSGIIEEQVIGVFLQYPLIPAWAITVHKSQGKTLDQVMVHLGRRLFAPGQLYVALSRCRSFGGIFLSRAIEQRDIFCDATVQQFYYHQQQCDHDA